MTDSIYLKLNSQIYLNTIVDSNNSSIFGVENITIISIYLRFKRVVNYCCWKYHSGNLKIYQQIYLNNLEITYIYFTPILVSSFLTSFSSSSSASAAFLSNSSIFLLALARLKSKFSLIPYL
jgi:hypothetical protein